MQADPVDATNPYGAQALTGRDGTYSMRIAPCKAYVTPFTNQPSDLPFDFYRQTIDVAEGDTKTINFQIQPHPIPKAIR